MRAQRIRNFGVARRSGFRAFVPIPRALNWLDRPGLNCSSGARIEVPVTAPRLRQRAAEVRKSGRWTKSTYYEPGRATFSFRQLWVFPFLVGLAAVTAHGQATLTPTAEIGSSSIVGFYHWGGRQANGFASGIQAVVGLNASISRITLSARMDVDYNRGTNCISGFSLPAPWTTRTYEALWRNPV